MRELQIPTGVAGDPGATEMVRYWLAHGEHHITLLLGMWEDARDCDVDELWAWGHVLRDIAQHVAHGLQKSHGWDAGESEKKILKHFVEAMKERSPRLEGEYPEDE